jgi:microcompartment protein CcmK/EutM
VNKMLDFVSNGLGKHEQMSNVNFSGVSSQEQEWVVILRGSSRAHVFQSRSLQFTSVIMSYAATFNTLHCHFVVFS